MTTRTMRDRPEVGGGTRYALNGSAVFLHKEGGSNVVHRLPASTYVVKEEPMSKMLYLDRIDDFLMPEKIYGDAQAQAERILGTFEDRPAATGVLFLGEKGSGKSLTAKLVCEMARRKGIPTILITDRRAGQAFNQFIQAIDQPAIVLFDEFDKVYPNRPFDDDDDDGQIKSATQDTLLTLLDGTYQTKKLFLFTANDRFKISRHMLNRPGRLYYLFEFSGLTEEFVDDYCADCLNDQSHVPAIQSLRNVLTMSFDMLSSLVEEMNRYGETPRQVLSVLNIRPDHRITTFRGEVLIGGKKAILRDENYLVQMDPFSGRHNLPYYESEQAKKNGDDSYVTIDAADMLRSVDAKTGVYTYEHGNIQVRLTRVQDSSYDFRNALAVGYD